MRIETQTVLTQAGVNAGQSAGHLQPTSSGSGLGPRNRAWADLEARGVVFPKLYRRLTSYFDSGGTALTSFLPWLAKTKEQVLDLSTGNFTHLDNVLCVHSGKIRLTHNPEQLVFVSAKTTSTTVAPWLRI